MTPNADIIRRVLAEVATPRDLLIASSAARENGRPDVHAFLQRSFRRGLSRAAVARIRDAAIAMLKTDLH